MRANKKLSAAWLKRAALLLLIAVMMLSAVACGSDDSDDEDVYTPPAVYVSPYVTMVKEATNSTYGITYGDAFDSFFSDPEWDYFKASTGEHVVEFEGGFLYDGAPATATIQFVLDMEEGTLTVYHLSINGVDQSKLMLSALVKKVFESY